MSSMDKRKEQKKEYSSPKMKVAELKRHASLLQCSDANDEYCGNLN